jgi:Family of unknown function (DUF6174)
MNYRIAFPTLSAILLAGCTLTGPGTAEEITELSQARQRWQNLQMEDYDMEMIRGCFCIGAGAMTVYVRDDSVAAIRQEDQYWGSDRDWWQYIPTVDGLFDLIEEASLDAYSVEVQYSTDGYPSEVSIDWIEMAVDDEISYTITNLKEATATHPVRLAPGEFVNVDGSRVEFDGIEEDSRCPRGADCIWAGRAVVALSVTVRDSVFHLKLVQGEVLEGESSTAQAGPLSLTVIAVSPYPQVDLTINEEDYRADLIIESK